MVRERATATLNWGAQPEWRKAAIIQMMGLEPMRCTECGNIVYDEPTHDRAADPLTCAGHT